MLPIPREAASAIAMTTSSFQIIQRSFDALGHADLPGVLSKRILKTLP